MFFSYAEERKDGIRTQEEEQLTKMLDSLRIRAETCVLQWSKVMEYQSSSATDSAKSAKSTISFLRSACEMVRSRSSKTAVTFLYLSKPPALHVGKTVSRDNAISEAENYLSDLAILTNHWPPTLMVRGVSPVTSTTL